MLRPLYPPGHKNAGTVKADKDLTEAEKETQRQQNWLCEDRNIPIERDRKLREFADTL